VDEGHGADQRLQALPEEVEQSLSACGGLEELIAHLPGDETLSRQSAIFRTLADPLRLKILGNALRATALRLCHQGGPRHRRLTALLPPRRPEERRTERRGGAGQLDHLSVDRRRRDVAQRLADAAADKPGERE